MRRYILTALLLALVYFTLNFYSTPTPVVAQEKTPDEILLAPQPLHTTSRFETKMLTQTEVLPRAVITKDDSNRELDDDTVVDEGKDGSKTTVYKIYYYEGAEYSRDVVSTDIVPAQDKIISHGTKIVWRTLDTPDGPIQYWRHLRVWATQYDSHCPGCDDYTAIGMKQGKGVVAVDPSVIKLRSQMYISGYGKAVAGDTGGAIKGNIIDLGFEDAHTSGWQSHFVDVYLTN